MEDLVHDHDVSYLMTPGNGHNMHVMWLIDSLVPAGAERSLVAMAPYLIGSGLKLDVVYLRDRPGLQSELLEAGARLLCLDGSGGPIGYIRRTRRLLTKEKPDILHTTLADSNVVGRIASVGVTTKVVSSLVNVQYGPEHWSDPNVRRWRMRMLQAVNALTARRVNQFHAVTREIAEVMARRLLIPRDRIEVIPRGRDPRSLGVRSPERRAAARQRLGVQEERTMILAVARHEYQKRLDVLLRAVPLLVEEGLDPVVFVAGRKGSTTSDLRAIVDAEGLRGRVTFLGIRDDVPELMCAADALVLPSRREGFPGVLVEALALETPIVASDLRGIREVVGGDTARLLQQVEPRTIARAIRDTVSQRHESQAMTARGRARFIERHTIEAVAERLIDLYDRTLECADFRQTA